MVRILYTVAWMDLGGSQTHLLQVLRRLDRTRFDPVLCCLTGRGVLLDAARETGVRVVEGGFSKGFRPPQSIRATVNLARFIRREGFDIVHNYLLRANIFGSVAARLGGTPILLCSKRGCHERRGWELAGARLSNWLADQVTTNAEAVREFVHGNEGCPKEKMCVIPSGIDTERFRPLPEADYKSRLGLDPRRPIVGTVTRGRVRKGVREFVEAMLDVRRAVPTVQVAVVGDVEVEPALLDLLAGAGFSADFHFVGRRSDMPEVLSALDVFVLPSHDEGMSNAILEAMAMEKPVVATDVGGTGEVVRHGVTGLLVPPREVRRLADAITDLLGDGIRRREMGTAGRPVVESGFSVAKMVQDMEDLYLRLIDGKLWRCKALRRQVQVGGAGCE